MPCKQGDIDVLVTAPINKHTVQSDDFEFPGHTDYLAQVSGSTALMFMISDELKVSLVTDHLPLRHVKHANHKGIKSKKKSG